MSNVGIDSSMPTQDSDNPQIDGSNPNPDAPITPGARTVFIIMMENKSDVQIFGNATDAPYINGLLTTAARATNMNDELPALVSEPHYVWLEAGTNVFSDTTFSGDADVTMGNSTASTAHLSTQLTTAGKTWIAYQEGITAGTCPIASTGEYGAKHDPFVFFRDVSGTPPKASTAGCASHHKVIADLATDVAGGTVPNYAFISPNLCNDMHGDLFCPSGLATASNITAGDTWLKNNLPPLIAYTHTHDAVVFIVWDEGDTNNKVPLMAIGDHVVPGVDATTYTHSSVLKTVERLLGVPALTTVASSTDLTAMFTPGYLP